MNIRNFLTVWRADYASENIRSDRRRALRNGECGRQGFSFFPSLKFDVGIFRFAGRVNPFVQLFVQEFAGCVCRAILAVIGLQFFKNGSVVVAEWGFCVVVRIKAVRDAGVLFRDETESAVLPFCAVHVTVLHIALILMADIRASRGAAEFQVGCMAV